MNIGRGSYGAVYMRDGMAVKKFRKLSHLLQEYISGSYLSDVDQVIKIRDVNLNTLELTMDLYDTDLRNWLEKKHASYNTKLGIFKDILMGLAAIHERHLTHGDIKPNNIMIKYVHSKTSEGKQGRSDDRIEKIPRAYIGDLGFVSVSAFSKVELTAPAYRDLDIYRGTPHDIFSLGMLAIELFGRYRIRKHKNYRDVSNSIEKSIRDEGMRDLIQSMTQANHEARPTAVQLLQTLYKASYSITLDPKPNSPRIDIEIVFNIMKNQAEEFDIFRAKRGYKAVYAHLVQTGNKAKYFPLFASCMMMILSSLFGTRGYSEKVVMEFTRYDLKTVKKALTQMIKNPELVKTLLLP
jgi:serine/threonine protein kinase